MKRKDNSQVAVAYGAIRDRIIAYDLAPDMLVSDSQLAQELGMSRAPIREAILLLQMDGLIEMDGNGKIRVSPITFDDAADILHVRLALEGEAIRLIAAAGWLADDQAAALTALHRQIAETADFDSTGEHFRCDDAFHQLLAEYSGSRRICEILGRMRLQMQRVRWLNLVNPSRPAATVREHQALLDALLARDLDGALAALEAHFTNSREAFRAVLTDRKIQVLAAVIRSFGTGNPTPLPAEAPE